MTQHILNSDFLVVLAVFAVFVWMLVRGNQPGRKGGRGRGDDGGGDGGGD